MGGDKLARPLRGRPLLHHPLLALDRVAAELIVAGPFAGPPLPLPAALAVRLTLTRDAQADAGPLAGLVAGLAAAHETVALVVGGDQPDLAPALLAGLAAALGRGIAGDAQGRGPAGAVVLADESGWQPLPCAVSTGPALVAARARLDGPRRSLRGLLEGLELAIVPEWLWRSWDPDGDWRSDIDVPADLERAERRAGRILPR